MRSVETKKVIEALLFLLEKPWIEKVYTDLAQIYASLGMTNESEAFELIISERFDGNNTDFNKK
jgi:hypothetical protein